MRLAGAECVGECERENEECGEPTEEHDGLSQESERGAIRYDEDTNYTEATPPHVARADSESSCSSASF